MKHIFSSNIPDSTYFRTRDVEPTISGDTVTLYNGQGTHRSWGCPGVTSTVVVDEHDFMAVHIGWYHKHGGGQTWRYYVETVGGIEQIGWGKLSDEMRGIVLSGYEKRAPSWSKPPGKLRSQYKVPRQETRTTYKAVGVYGGRMWSLYDGETEYVLGKRLSQAVGSNAGYTLHMGRVTGYFDPVHNGGYYSHPSMERVKELLEKGKLVPGRCLEGVSSLAIIECEVSGRIVEFPNGKLASTYLTPVRVVEEISV